LLNKLSGNFIKKHNRAEEIMNRYIIPNSEEKENKRFPSNSFLQKLVKVKQPIACNQIAYYRLILN